MYLLSRAACAPPSWKLCANLGRAPMPCRVPIWSFTSFRPTRHRGMPLYPGPRACCETSVLDLHDVPRDIASRPHRKCCRKSTTTHRSFPAFLSRPVCSLPGLQPLTAMHRDSATGDDRTAWPVSTHARPVCWPPPDIDTCQASSARHPVSMTRLPTCWSKSRSRAVARGPARG